MADKKHGIVKLRNDSIGRLISGRKIRAIKNGRAFNPSHTNTIFKEARNLATTLCEIIRLICNLSRTLLTFSQNSRNNPPEICSLIHQIVSGPAYKPDAGPSPRCFDSG